MGNDTRGFRRLAVGIALAATMLMALAGTAQAEEIVLSESMIEGSAGEIDVTGDVPAGANRVAVAECNLDEAVDWEDFGKRCNFDTASPLISATTFVNSGYHIEVTDTFLDYDFTTRTWPAPATSTECGDTEGDEDCAIVVSYYSFTPPSTVVPLGAEAEEITFENP
jgi:hypothetical protein